MAALHCVHAAPDCAVMLFGPAKCYNIHRQRGWHGLNAGLEALAVLGRPRMVTGAMAAIERLSQLSALFITSLEPHGSSTGCDMDAASYHLLTSYHASRVCMHA
jgi:hypothetical protein